MRNVRGLTIVIKGAGEMATGIACRLYMANLTRILMLEKAEPVAIRRPVAFSESVFTREAEVEGVRAKLVTDCGESEALWDAGSLGVMVDPGWKSITALEPDVVVDAILAKKNLGTTRQEAPLTIGVGPGFTAPGDVHVVVESNRGHNLGRLIHEGAAEPHTGIPGSTMGYTFERVLRAPHAGKVRHEREIGDAVKKGDTILYVDGAPVAALIDGVLRGLIREIHVAGNEKVADIDPRGQKEYCYTITDKARAIGGGVLEAVLERFNRG